MSNELSVPNAVASIVTRNHILYECLKLKIVNYHALATKIQPEVERLKGKSVSINTIVVAVKRLSDKVAESTKLEPSEALREAKMTLTSDVTDITIKAKPEEIPAILKEITQISSSLRDIPHIFRLLDSIKIIADLEDYERIRKTLSRWEVIRDDTNLSKLSLHLTPKAEKNPGIAAFITELLYRSGVNTIGTFIGEDAILLLDRKDGPRAYEILEREIRTSDA